MAEVMGENKRKVLISFRDQALAIPLYSSAKRKAYYSEDFLESDSLIYIMNEVFSGESDVTDDGKKFLKEFWGHENLAHILMGNGKFDYDYSEQELLNYLAEMVPNEVGDFIREAQEKSK